MGYLYKACDQISDFYHQQLLRIMRRKISWTDGRTEGRKDGRRTDRQTDRGKTVYPPPPSGSGGINIYDLRWISVYIRTRYEQLQIPLFFCNVKVDNNINFQIADTNDQNINVWTWIAFMISHIFIPKCHRKQAILYENKKIRSLN